MAAIARLAAIALDSSDPGRLAAFYRDFLGGEIMFETDDFVAIKGSGVLLTMQRVEGYQPPDWPACGVPKQMHLELAVTDLEAAQAEAIALGARVADAQPSPDRWRVLLDPAGHPFCITTLIPDL
jgi:hypothetical protein